MARTFAIADLHGRDDLLSRALDLILSYDNGSCGTIVTLGDYVDRGPESRRFVERRIAGPPPNWRMIPLKGNHEDMMQQCCRDTSKLGWWIENGGGTTLISYGQSYGDYADPGLLPQAHLDWIDNLSLMHMDEHRVFVHAGVDPGKPLDSQTEHDLLWKRYPSGFDVGHGQRHLVHGHSPDPSGPKTWGARTDLDTLAWATGRLVVGVFDDALPGGPVDYIVVT